jgi:hypothetical protein
VYAAERAERRFQLDTKTGIRCEPSTPAGRGVSASSRKRLCALPGKTPAISTLKSIGGPMGVEPALSDAGSAAVRPDSRRTAPAIRATAFGSSRCLNRIAKPTCWTLCRSCRFGEPTLMCRQRAPVRAADRRGLVAQ